jgi:hypothetical protein
MQLLLPMLTYYEGPRPVSPEVLAGVLTYREAVRVCWQLRTRRNMTQRVLAEESLLYASHVTDYLSDKDAKRELPAKHVAAFEVACGNRVISQWLAREAHLTILEQFLEPKRATA